MAVLTNCLFVKATPEEDQRYAVCRTLPFHSKGFSLDAFGIHHWHKRLAPSSKLLWDWKQQSIGWEEYTRRYTEEMAQQQELIDTIAHRAMEENVTLLCYEKEDNPHCHRHLLKKIIEKAQTKL